MSYACIKKIKLGDREFHPGEIVPDEAFVGGRADKLKSYGYIAEMSAEGVLDLTGVDVEPVGYMTVILAGEEVAVSAESLQGIADIMQKNADDAAEAIAEEVDESILAFIAACDSRKGVQKAVQKQLAVISSIKGETNEAVGDSGESDGDTEE